MVRSSPMPKPRTIKQKGPFAYTYSPFHKPIARVHPGEVVTLLTADAFENKLNSPRDLCTRKCRFPFVNPQTGPLFIEGARPGDTLAVKIHDIQPDRAYAV